MDEMQKELALILNQPEKWWNLQVQEEKICESSYLEAWRKKIFSWFSPPPEELSSRLTSLSKLAEVDEVVKGQMERIKIIASKNANSWFHHLADERKDLLIHNEGIIHEGGMQPLKINDVYYNYPGEPIWKKFAETLYLLFPGSREVDPLGAKIEEIWTEPNLITHLSSDMGCKVTWIGHATTLIQFQEINLLIDPSFSFVTPCFQRHVPPAIPFSSLPPIDVIALSHNHGDHTQYQGFMKEQPYCFVPQNMDRAMKKEGFLHVDGNDWWQSRTIKKGRSTLRLISVPAKHGSTTTLTDVNKALWQGIVIECLDEEEIQSRIYFAGDTGFDQKIFEQIRDFFGEIDLALLPIAPEGEEDVHLTAEQAFEAFEILNAKKMIPIHWGAYRTGTERIIDPILLLRSHLEKEQFKPLRDRVESHFLVGSEIHLPYTSGQ